MNESGKETSARDPHNLADLLDEPSQAELRAEVLRGASLSTSPEAGDRCLIHHPFPLRGDCEECQRQEKERTERTKKAHTAKVETLLGGIRLGRRYRGKTFADYDVMQPLEVSGALLGVNQDAARVKAKCEGYARSFADRLEAGDNLLMLGNYGTGKNMLAACICQEIALRGFSSVHTTALKMLRRIKSTWRKGSTEDEQMVIDAFALPDLLVVDEIGVQFGTDTEKLLLFEALNGRYEERRPTILISNLKEAAELSEYLGERVMDRMREGQTGILKFTWDSYRGRA